MSKADFDPLGYNRDTGDKFDEDGYDRWGYNRAGFGINGLDRWGYNSDGDGPFRHLASRLGRVRARR